MNAQSKAVVVDIYRNLARRQRNINRVAYRAPFGRDRAELDRQVADGMRWTLQCMAEHVFEVHGNFDVEKAAVAADWEDALKQEGGA